MSRPTHQTARRFQNSSNPIQHSERLNLAAGESQEFSPPYLQPDLLYLTEEDLKDRGMEGCVPAGVADRVWPPGHPLAGQYVYPGNKVYTSVTPPGMTDRHMSAHLNAKRRARPSFTLAKYPDDHPDVSLRGQYIPSLDDQVYATYDREEYLNHGERSQDFRNRKAREAFEGIVSRNIQSADAAEGVVRNFDQDESTLRRHREQAHRFMQGISHERFPKSMTLDQIREQVGEDTVRATERKYARGSRTPQPGEYERWEEAQAEKASKAKGKKITSYPGQPAR